VGVTRHSEHLIKITRLGLINCYLVVEDDGLTLIDTLIGGSAKAILQGALDQQAPIVRIALTHGHSDHAGSVEALTAELPEAELSCSAREARFMGGDSSMDPGEPQRRPRMMTKLRSKPARELMAGDRVGSLEVMDAPGHTPGQIAFLDTRDRSLIAGDAYHTVGGVTVTSRVNPRFPFPTLASWDRPTARASGRALADLKPSRLAVGHGHVVEAPGPAMEQALSAAG